MKNAISKQAERKEGGASSTPFCKNDRLLATIRGFVHPVYRLDVAAAVYHGVGEGSQD